MTQATQRLGRGLVALAVVLVMAVPAARAQEFGLDDEIETIESESVRRFRQLTDPEGRSEPAGRDQRPPFEFYRTQVAPFDVLTFIKPGHWVSLTQELQANLFDYEGGLQTAPIPLLDMPRSVVFRRDVRLPKQEQMRLNWTAFFPVPARSLEIELARPNAIRPDDSTQAPLLPMMTHQMLIVVLADDPMAYDLWKRYQAIVPATSDLTDQQVVERTSYYRLVISQDPARPNLTAHPLTWTTVSHVIWDGFDPNGLDVGQQRALIDWLHWGGQLIITGGASTSQALLADSESFLAPYLPAEPSPDSSTLTQDDLRALAIEYLPPTWRIEREIDALGFDYSAPEQVAPRPSGFQLSRYGPVDPITLPPDRTLFLSGLDPMTDDAQWITDDQGNRLAIERRVGRGRIVMLAFDPKEAALQRWKGNDTFVRRVLLRRPEDRWNPYDPSGMFMLSGPELSWYRLLGRDLEPLASARRTRTRNAPDPTVFNPAFDADPAATLPQAPVAAWLDTARLPSMAREGLVAASGIEVPGSPFVLRVILAYLVALVPLNWLVCRFVLRRRELAWAVVPLLSFGFAVAVERAAAIDTGYDRACDEIDLLELQPGYTRAHLNRFAVLYSTGRERFSISYPNDPSALALPLNANLAIRGEQIVESTWQTSPGPSLLDFRVEPRSLAMIRAEQMVDLRGGLFVQETDDGQQVLVNQTELDLRDAVLVDVGAVRIDRDSWNLFRPLGPIPAGEVVPVPGRSDGSIEAPEPGDSTAAEGRPDWIDLESFLDVLRSYSWGRPEDAGELRLVAWVDRPMPGQELSPEVDRHRGFTLVVAHLGYGPPPPPDGPAYTSHRPRSPGDPGREPLAPETDRP